MECVFEMREGRNVLLDWEERSGPCKNRIESAVSEAFSRIALETNVSPEPDASIVLITKIA